MGPIARIRSAVGSAPVDMHGGGRAAGGGEVTVEDSGSCHDTGGAGRVGYSRGQGIKIEGKLAVGIVLVLVERRRVGRDSHSILGR